MKRLDGKVAVITGAASGIGFATAQRFAREGAIIAGVDLATQPPTWKSVQVAAPETSFVGLIDVRDESAVQHTIEGVRKDHGRIDVLVNAAGVEGLGLAHQLDVAEWDRTLDINLKGSFLVAKHAIPAMIEQNSGAIVHIASVEGMEGLYGAMPYNVSKGGVIQMTRSMAVDYARNGIRVNCVCPGLIDTPLTAVTKEPGLEAVRNAMISWHLLDRAGLPEEVAAAILFLASDEASFITGHPLVVDGGWTVGKRIDYDV